MITRTRFTISFFKGPCKGPNAWQRNKLRSAWVCDAFKDEDGATVAVRCYKTVMIGIEERIQDGWLVKRPEEIAKKRAELKEVLRSPYASVVTEAPDTRDGPLDAIRTISDITL